MPTRHELLDLVDARLSALTGFTKTFETDPERVSMYLSAQQAQAGYSLDMDGAVVAAGRQNKRAQVNTSIVVGLLVDVRQYDPIKSIGESIDKTDQVVQAMMGGYPGWQVFWEGSEAESLDGGALRSVIITFTATGSVDFAGVS
mgnify:CR=1 FL=1